MKSTDRTASLLRLCPDLFDHKSVLYVGARDDRMDYGNEFLWGRCEVIVLEAYEENVRYLREHCPWLENVLHLDVRQLLPYEVGSAMAAVAGWPEIQSDVVFWWHGPEHIEKDKLAGVLKNLETCATEAVVLGCPWGKFKQGAHHGNPYERHLSHYNWQTFEELGYTVECLGKRKQRGSNITAVKYL